MKFIPIAEIDTVNNALNFSTQDRHVIGSCDIYATKAAGGDKKLYRDIENELEAKHDALRRLSASLSPVSPSLKAMTNDGDSSQAGIGRKHTPVVDNDIDLSRSSPFGDLGSVTARRTFAYLIATLNASHPDYDFTHILRPSDFVKRSLRGVKEHIDNILQSLRPKQTAALRFLSPSALSKSAPAGSGLSSEIWSDQMWLLIDKEMSLRNCEKYAYVPDDDPFDGEEGALESMHYFFFNRDRKRVCYIYLRCFSVISHSPVHIPKMPQASKSQRQTSSFSHGEGAGKRAAFYFSEEKLSRSVHNAGYDDDDEEMMFSEHEDEIDVPFMDLDDIRSDIANGGSSYAYEDENDYDDDATRYVGSIAEDIGEAMEMDY